MRRFILFLAKELGMSPRQVLATHTSRDISEWVAYHSLEAKEMKQKQLSNRAQSNAQAAKANYKRTMGNM